MPIWITTNFKVMKLKRGQIILNYPYRKNFFFGDCGSVGLQEMQGGIYMEEGAKLILNAMCVIGQGATLRCDKNAIIELGKNFYCNKNCHIRSAERITIGDECSLGWNVQINTDDGHSILHDGKPVKRVGSIEIGNHVWVTSNSIITKNVNIADGCIVAQGAVVSKSVTESNSLVGGIPAKVIRTGIEWEK
jgi:acetyltransferase-like isoleucine patch superfamily enzyme